MGQVGIDIPARALCTDQLHLVLEIQTQTEVNYTSTHHAQMWCLLMHYSHLERPTNPLLLILLILAFLNLICYPLPPIENIP